MSQPTAPVLHTHPLTGEPIRPVGYVRGRAVWPIMGGAPDDPPAGGAPTNPPAGDPPAGPAGGGGVDLSKLSVDELKAHPQFQTELNRVVGERVTREQQKWQTELEKERQRAGLDDAGKLKAEIEDERKKAREATKAVQAAREQVARTEAKVLAIAEGGRSDRAAAIVGQADLTGAVDADGNVVEGVLRAAVLKVLDQYPEWKATAGGDGTSQPPPARSGGELNPAGGNAPKFTQSQIEAMGTEERVERWEEIEKAIAEGRIVYGK